MLSSEGLSRRTVNPLTAPAFPSRTSLGPTIFQLKAAAGDRMPPFLYRCPNTGYRVQGFVAEGISDHQTYLSVTCIMCRQIHLVNPSTGRVVSEDDNTSASTAPAAW
jgi:hypothetical protein